MKALEILSHENNINFSAYFIGDGPLKKKCEILSNKLNLKSKVFFKGFKKDIRNELKKMQVMGFADVNVTGIVSGDYNEFAKFAMLTLTPLPAREPKADHNFIWSKIQENMKTKGRRTNT